VLEFGSERMTRFTFNPQMDTCPVWSPDARQIAFSSDRTGSRQIYRKDAGGAGGAERLPATVEASSRLVRMPLWVGLGPEGVARVVESVERFFRSGR